MQPDDLDPVLGASLVAMGGPFKARLTHLLNTAQAPGSPEEQHDARHAADCLFWSLFACVLRELFPGDDPRVEALVEYCEAKGKDWRGWVQ